MSAALCGTIWKEHFAINQLEIILIETAIKLELRLIRTKNNLIKYSDSNKISCKINIILFSINDNYSLNKTTSSLN